MNYTIQSETENGPMVIKSQSLVFSCWVADKMAEDFGTACVFENKKVQPVYTAVQAASAPELEGGAA